MRSAFCIIPLIVLLACVFAVQTDATQIIHKTPKQLGAQSSIVVQGRVTGVRSYWNEQRTKIFTETLIAVDQSYKGENSGVVRVVQLGGTVDNVRVTVAGALRWTEGEEVLLFLEPLEDDAFRVAGFCQGKFNIERDPSTGKALVKRPAMEGVEILGAESAGEGAQSSATRDVTVEEFVAQALGSGKGGSR